MKFLHTSDLHLGKRLHEMPLIDDQRHILSEICRIAEENNCDAVVAAGDIYDKSAPSAEAVALFDRFVTELHEKGIALIANYGNHDSADRVGFASALLSKNGVFLSPRFDGKVEKAIFRDEYGEVRVHLLPFLKPVTVTATCPDGDFDSWDGALGYAIGLAEADFSQRNVIVCHQFVTGGERSESEEVNVGGADNVSASLFDGFDYVALGHLHKPQRIACDTVRYSGSPLKYSLDEHNSEKSVVIVTLSEKGRCDTETVPLVPLHDVRRLCGTYEELTLRRNYEGTETEDYFHVVLLDEDYIPDALYRLRTIYPNIMKLEYANIRSAHNADMDEVSDALAGEEEMTPSEMFEALYRVQNNAPMSESERSLSERIFERLNREDGV
ncbi:MAG: exonuclease SbcCD subunit D [Ruminococcaceae bacterium]|nr:exonuclease SbcCD subunit D [Oscillospiraceae bacterium]